MNEQQAARLVGLLVGATTGWGDGSGGDAAVVLYTRNIVHEWHDPQAATTAIEQIIETWTQPSRPTWGVLHQAYRDCRRRIIMTAPALESGGRPVSPEQGRRIAARAYAEECERQGRTPDDVFLERLVGRITP